RAVLIRHCSGTPHRDTASKSAHPRRRFGDKQFKGELMHKSTGVVLALSTALAAFGAQAQTSGNGTSNVTAYGIIDAYVQTARGASSLQRVQSGGLMGSRLGLKGTEDLGSGLRAFYVLEGGINTDDGSSAQGGVLFGRQAVVGLGSERFGQI